MIKRTTCRISGEPLEELFSLGSLYVSDFLEQGVSSSSEDKVDLTLCLAPKSELVQLNCTADLDRMYSGRYWYCSGTNDSMVTELKGIVRSITNLVELEKGDVWLDIGCNDGTLLKEVPDGMIKVGFDPSKTNYLQAKSIDDAIIINDYFNTSAFSENCNKRAKVITSIAMMYDLEDPHQFVEEVQNSLEDDGIWIVQLSYLPLMLCQLAFDNICHEHLEYYSLRVLKNLLDEHDFEIVDFSTNDTNGGSCRLYIQKSCCNHKNFGTAPFRDVAKFRLDSALAYEEVMGLANHDTYVEFFKKIESLKHQTMNFLESAKSKGKKIWGYGASTKGNTLLQYFGIDYRLVDAIAERQPTKYGLRTTGTEIPIKSESDFRKARPDYCLVLPWHFINEFKNREKKYLDQGGKFIVPCPTFEII